MMVGFYILIALSGVFMQVLHANEFENERFGLLIESIFGSFLFKGGAALVHMVFLTYIKELYKAEIRNTMFSVLCVIGKLLVLALPQIMDIYTRIGLHVLAGTSVWFVIGIPLQMVLPETFGSCIDYVEESQESEIRSDTKKESPRENKDIEKDNVQKKNKDIEKDKVQKKNKDMEKDKVQKMNEEEEKTSTRNICFADHDENTDVI